MENNPVIPVTELVTTILLDIDTVDPPAHADEAYVNACCEYIKDSLKQVYKDTLKKVVYEEYLVQLVYEYFGDRLYDNPFHFQESVEDLQVLRNRVAYLKTVPQPVQRSEAWYSYRQGRITASDAACVFGKNAFKSRNVFLQDKIDPSKAGGCGLNDIVLHGIRLEDSIANIYAYRSGQTVREYGCIPHDTLPYLGASPDGITEEGVMLEIKCPYSRPIYEIPPVYYWYQIQVQLEVADLNRCDYVECEIKVIPREEYVSLMEADPEAWAHETGCLVEYYDNTKGAIDHEHGPFGESLQRNQEWAEQTEDQVLADPGLDYRNTIYWQLKRYSCIPIYRDARWFARANPEFKAFWEEVEEGRRKLSGSDVASETSSTSDTETSVVNQDDTVSVVSVATPEAPKTAPTKTKRTKKPSVCMVLSDSDSD